ncbi:MAG: hypothetical protein WB438_04260 [Candidatus Cybelea sp.]
MFLSMLLSAVTPVPVIVRSMPPVQVATLPGPDEYVRASVTIALVALVVATITLLRVNRQIEIANKELKAVQDDFELAQKQFKEITRRPAVTVDGRIDYQAVYISGNTRAGFVVKVQVSNTGKRLARSVIAELLIPESANPTIDSMAWGGPRNFRVALLSKDSILFRVFTIDLPDLHPNGVQVSSSFPGTSFISDIPECRLFLRVYDENFGYPEDAPQWLTYRSQVLGAEAQPDG